MTATVVASDPRWAQIGLTYRQLWRWTTWGYLHCVGDRSPGSGHLRRWPETEIAVAARMLSLIGDGFTLRAAAERARIPSVVASFLRPGDKPACRNEGVDPEWFFPTRLDVGKRGSLSKARAVCRRCPLKTRCADWAAGNHMRFGVWGGLTAKQLDQRRRCMAGRCHHPTCWEAVA